MRMGTLTRLTPHSAIPGLTPLPATWVRCWRCADKRQEASVKSELAKSSNNHPRQDPHVMTLPAHVVGEDVCNIWL